MDPNSPVGGIPAGSASDPLKLNHNIKVPTAKIAPETETNNVAVKSFSSRTHESELASVSVFERAWVHFKSFFTSTGASIYNFFAGLFGGTPVAHEKDLHSYVKVPDIIDDRHVDAHAAVVVDANVVLDDLYKLDSDDGVLYNMDAVEEDALDVADETLIESILENVESIGERLRELEVDPNNPSIALVLYGDLKEEFQGAEELMNAFKESLDTMEQRNTHAFVGQFRRVEGLLKQKELEVERAFENIVSRSLADVKPIKSVKPVRPVAQVLQVSQNLPVGIPNDGRNACFRISSIQALLAQDPIKRLIKSELAKQPGELKEEFAARGWVKNALENLIDLMQNGASPEEIKSAEIYLAEIIFGYEAGDPRNLHLEFAKPDIKQLEEDYEFEQFDNFVKEDFETYKKRKLDAYKTKQFDAVAFLELILGTVLNYTHDARLTNFVESQGVKGVEISEDLAVLDRNKSSASITLFDDIKDLQGLVDANYIKKPIDDALTLQKITYDRYKQTSRVVTAPQDVLVVQLDRRKYDFRVQQTIVNNRPVDMPADGLLDYSVAHGMEKGTLKYGVNSFIRLHADSGESGHYTTYAMRNGRWFHFDDGRAKAVSDEEAQLEMKQAYILMLERMK